MCPALPWSGPHRCLLLMPAFQQYSGTLRSCSRIALESLNTLTYRQYNSHLGVSSGVAHYPAGLSARSLGGSAIAASLAPSQRSEGSRSPAARASTGATLSIPSLESISVFNGSLSSGRSHRALNGNVQTQQSE